MQYRLSLYSFRCPDDGDAAVRIDLFPAAILELNSRSIQVKQSWGAALVHAGSVNMLC